MEFNEINREIIGLSTASLVEWSPGCVVHADIIEALTELVVQGRKAGFDIQVASGHRSFSRQKMIWNDKVRGDRAVLDGEGNAIDIQACDSWFLAQQILRWSALPGASRHHWGTELDIFDAAAVPETYRLQLVPAEYADSGVFGPLNYWLAEYLASKSAVFFRPYAIDRGGVAPEPWHISYAPRAVQYQRLLSCDLIRTVIIQEDIDLAQCLIDHIDDIYQRFVWVPAELYPESSRVSLLGVL